MTWNTNVNVTDIPVFLFVSCMTIFTFFPIWSQMVCVELEPCFRRPLSRQHLCVGPEGIICLKLAPELIAVGQYSRRLFQVPILPSNGPVIENLIAFGERRKQRVYFFLPESQQEFKYVGGGQNFLSCCLWNRTLRQPIHCKLISV